MNETSHEFPTESGNALTAEQMEELLISYEESFDSKNLISHEEVKKQLEKRLKNKSGQFID